MIIWRNSNERWGAVSILLHWFTAVCVFGLYWLGWYMVQLDYYDPWYRSAPFWHKSVGILLVLIIVSRILLRLVQGVPQPLSTHQRWEKRLASVVHAILYILLFAIFVSGYFISTADGRSIDVFGLIAIPAVVSDVDNLEDLAGSLHVLFTDTLIVLALVHAVAGLKHHFVDRDDTLRRMLSVTKHKKEEL